MHTTRMLWYAKNKLTIKELIHPASPSDPMPVRALIPKYSNKDGTAYSFLDLAYFLTFMRYFHGIFHYPVRVNLTNNEISEQKRKNTDWPTSS